MANRRPEGVSYRPFRAEPLLADGLLAVARPGGEFMERVSAAMFNMADQLGQEADRQAVRAGKRAGEADSLQGGPTATVDAVPAGSGTVRGKRFAGPVGQAIAQAAAKHGVDGGTLSRIAQLESGGNPRAKNPSSSAGGLFQFIDSTARQFGLADRYDPFQSADAAARLLKANAGVLRRALGREPTPGELYLAHQQGAGGAAKLLSNPDASATSIVGAAAVRLNGGRPGMTARQFANLWIRKAENGGVLPASADGIDLPDTVTMAPQVRLAGGTWRPSGSDTIYGRAYDEAGARTYVQQLDTDTRSAQSQLADRYKDDPQGLTQALSDLKRDQIAQHVFPEIRADYEAGFDRMALSYVEKARDGLAMRVKEQDAADFVKRGGELSTVLARNQASVDPDSAGAADALAGSLSAIDSYFDEGVARGTITPAKGEEAKAKARNATAVSWYTAQAAKRDADGVVALHEQMRKDFVDGGIAGLDGDGWTDLEVQLAAIEQKKRQEAAKIAGDLAAAGKTITERVASGYGVDQAALTALELAAKGTPNGDAIVAGVRQKVAAAEAIRVLPIDDAQAYVDQMRQRMGDNPSNDEIDALNDAQKAVDNKARDLAKDPLTYASRTGRMELVPIASDGDLYTMGGRDALSMSLAQRWEQAASVSRTYGVLAPLFTTAEATAIKNGAASTDPKRYMASMLQADWLADRTDFQQVENTFGKDTADKLLDWRSRARYATSEEVKAWLKERSDPQWSKRVQPLIDAGRKKAREVAFSDLADEFDTAWLGDPSEPVDPDTRRMFLTDFERIAGERFAVTGDFTEAREQALEKMKRVWGPTFADGSRGGRLMAYPPERYYPEVAGSRAWIAAELADLAKARGIDMTNLSLVADGKTRDAAERGERPGYLMTTVDPETGLDELLTDEQGRVVRHYFDPEAAIAGETKRAADEQAHQHDPWLVLGKGTSIGPFYGPFRPATDADMKARAKAVDRLLSERADRFQQKRRIRALFSGTREKN